MIKQAHQYPPVLFLFPLSSNPHPGIIFQAPSFGEGMGLDRFAVLLGVGLGVGLI